MKVKILLTTICLALIQAMNVFAQKSKQEQQREAYYYVWNNYPYKKALKHHTFRYSNDQDSVTCIRKKEIAFENVFISGFDVDNDSIFYFAGGNPLYITCIKSRKVAYRRMILSHNTKVGLFRLHGDSLYLVDDKNMDLIAMHKNGKGNLTRKHIDIDNITYGTMRPDTILVCEKKDKETYKAYCIGYDGKVKATPDINNDYEEWLYPFYYRLSRRYYYCNYKGEWNNWKIFFGGADIPGYKEIHLVNKENDKIYLTFRYPKEMPHTCQNPNGRYLTPITNESGRSLDDTTILRGSHFYEICYHDCGMMYVEDIDLEKIFKCEF